MATDEDSSPLRSHGRARPGPPLRLISPLVDTPTRRESTLATHLQGVTPGQARAVATFARAAEELATHPRIGSRVKRGRTACRARRNTDSSM